MRVWPSSSPCPVQRSHKPATPIGLPSTREIRVGTGLPLPFTLRQSSSKNAMIGTMQRCPFSQASRKLLEVVTVSDRALTSLGERSLASEADLTQGGTRPHWPVTSSRATGAGSAPPSTSVAGTGTGSAASSARSSVSLSPPTRRMNTPVRRARKLRSRGGAGGGTSKASGYSVACGRVS